MKTNNNLKCLFVVLLFASQAMATHAAGTIAFGNSALARFLWHGSPTPYLVGVFWGTNRDDLTLVFPLGTVNPPSGILTGAASVYGIPGTEPGQTVYMQIRGWNASFGTNWMQTWYQETDIRQVRLGPVAGPGTVIWQSITGNDPSRFYPLVLGCPLTPPAVVQLGSPLNQPVTVDAGNRGTVDAIIPVTRYTRPGASTNLNYISTVVVSTTNMTALAGEDYVAAYVAVSFGPGETLKYARIKIIGDSLPEPDEQFGVYLSRTGSCVSVDPSVLPVTIRDARVHLARMEAGKPVISFPTTTSQYYVLESSTNLLQWSLVPGAEHINGTGNEIEFKDLSFDCCGHRFYRSRLGAR